MPGRLALAALVIKSLTPNLEKHQNFELHQMWFYIIDMKIYNLWYTPGQTIKPQRCVAAHKSREERWDERYITNYSNISLQSLKESASYPSWTRLGSGAPSFTGPRRDWTCLNRDLNRGSVFVKWHGETHNYVKRLSSNSEFSFVF